MFARPDLSRWAFAGTACFLALLTGWWVEKLSTQTGTRLSFLSVGQGDCAVFQHEGWTVLIDAGPKTDSFDAGERIVVPELRRLGVRAIDMVVISHPDIDHIGGLPGIAKHFRIGAVAFSDEFRGRDDVMAILREAGIAEHQIVWVPSWARARLGQFDAVMHAPRAYGSVDDNDKSLYVLLENGPARAVFTGDAPSEGERRALLLADWTAQILKAGHHGSRGSTSSAWLEAVQPKWVILSAGRGNSYGHPDPAVLSRIEEAGSVPLRTDIKGTITFGVGPEGFALK